MAGPDPDTLKRGERIGKSAASPLITFLRVALSPDVSPVSVAVQRGPGTLKKITVVPGVLTTADAGTTFTLAVERGGSPVTVWTGALGAWPALTATVLSSATFALLENDILFWQVTGGGAASLPNLLLLVEVEL